MTVSVQNTVNPKLDVGGAASLENKIKNKTARIALIGLGYVGLPLAISFAQRGFKVTGIDTNEGRVERIGKAESYITDVTKEEMLEVTQSECLKASTDFSLLSESDVIIICVPTPIKRKYTPDVSYILSAIKSVAQNIKPGTLVILESTTYPGTTEELIKPELEKSGMVAGQDFFVAFSPERIDPGNKQFNVTTMPKVVGGLTPQCTKLAALVYQQITDHVHVVSSTKAAEMAKLLENSFRIVNIGWINEIAQMCHALGINVWEVIDAAKTKPFGFMPFYPGLGVGGHCIPEDPLYLYWKAKRYGFNSKFIKLSADINANMPAYVVYRLGDLVKEPKDKKILVLGVTYKKDVKDLRKSPPLKLLELLKREWGQVDYHDPLVPYLKLNGFDMHSVDLDVAGLQNYDCVVVAVDHTNVDYALVRQNARLIFDVKNVYQEDNPKIMRL
jgi:UDP-N-acetyl-D-glucosamine dehydrogenase